MNSIKLGRLLGFPIEIRGSFLILLAVVAFSGLLRGHPLLSILLLAITFGSVLLHELGHAVVARRLGVPMLGIDLHVFGGAAKMAGMPKTARDEILIAAAGPAVSLALSLLGGLLYAVTGLSLFYYLAWTNGLLGVFNLLPALPMDGGRIFRAAVSHKLGRVRATELAVKVSHYLAIAIGIFGLVWGNLWLAALAVMLYFMGSSELSQVHLWRYQNERSTASTSSGPGAFWSTWFGGARPSSPPTEQAASSPEHVEVIDRDGRTVYGTSTVSTPSAQEASFTIEQEQDARGRAIYVVRDAFGRVVLRTEHPVFP
jgi:Zn-dependent protease